MCSYISLDKLPSELLLIIFPYLDDSDLINLKEINPRLKNLVNHYFTILRKRNISLVTNQFSKHVRSRSLRYLLPKEQCRISENWQKAKYKEKNYFGQTRDQYIPRVQLEKGYVWFSRGQVIERFPRSDKQIRVKHSTSYRSSFASEVSRFFIKKGYIISCNEDGLWLYSLNQNRMIFEVASEFDLDCFDTRKSVIVAGGRDDILTIYTHDFQRPPLISVTRNMYDRIWSIALSRNKLAAVGLAANNSIESIKLLDLNRDDIVLSLTTGDIGSGILDIKWESATEMWSCGYDSTLRLWDMRTGNCEQIRQEPYGTTLYCLETDYVNTIITGASSHGKVSLWDKRRPEMVQMYFMRCCRGRNSSPVYSLSFDAEQLFVATVRNLTTLDFSVTDGIAKDYSNCFTQQIR